MIGCCKVCNHAGSVHSKLKLCGGCMDSYREEVEPIASSVPLPPLPTTYPPGSAGKEYVMTLRRKARVQLFHPCDATAEGDETPIKWINADAETRLRLIRSKTRKSFSLFFAE